MFEFKVVLEKDDAQKYLNENGLDTDISKMMVMSVLDGEKIAGVGAVSMENNMVVIEQIKCDDDTLEYAMGKSLLNSLDLGGIKTVYINNSLLENLAKKLRFNRNEDGNYSLNLEGYFTGRC